jgi:hypothetical protein
MATAVPPPAAAAAINRDILALVPRIGFRFAESLAISASFVINCILEHAAGGPPRHTFDQWLSLTFGANRNGYRCMDDCHAANRRAPTVRLGHFHGMPSHRAL